MTNKEYSCWANSVELVAKMDTDRWQLAFPHFANILGLHCVSTLDIEMVALEHLLW